MDSKTMISVHVWNKGQVTWTGSGNGIIVATGIQPYRGVQRRIIPHRNLQQRTVIKQASPMKLSTKMNIGKLVLGLLAAGICIGLKSSKGVKYIIALLAEQGTRCTINLFGGDTTNLPTILQSELYAAKGLGQGLRGAAKGLATSWGMIQKYEITYSKGGFPQVTMKK